MQLIESAKPLLRKPKNGWTINKIKIKHGKDFKLEMVSELPAEEKETKILKCVYQEQPKNDLYKAFELILGTLINRLDLRSETWRDAKITEIILKETEEGTNANITACLDFEDESKAIAKLEEKDISYELKTEIDNLLAEIEDYVGGDRQHKQLSLLDQ